MGMETVSLIKNVNRFDKLTLIVLLFYDQRTNRAIKHDDASLSNQPQFISRMI